SCSTKRGSCQTSRRRNEGIPTTRHPAVWDDAHWLRAIRLAAVGRCAATVAGVGRGLRIQGRLSNAEDVRDTYDAVDLNRAISTYRFFYPTVSGAAIFEGNAKVGVQPNKTFGWMDTQPRHVGYTLNSDTPYGGILLDLHAGPMVIELPPG